MPQTAEVEKIEAVSENVSENVSVHELVNPFCNAHPKPYQDLKELPAFQLANVEIDEKTHAVTPVYEAYDLVKLVQSSKDLCGMDYMKKLLATGQAKPEDFYDDGKAGVDTTIIPSTVHEAKALADKEQEKLATLSKSLGLKDGKEYSAEDLEEAVTAAVKKIYEAKQAQLQQKEGDK